MTVRVVMVPNSRRVVWPPRVATRDKFEAVSEWSTVGLKSVIAIDGGTYIMADGTTKSFPKEKTRMACKGASKRSGKRGK